jgi:hypothetical protein
MCFALKQGCFMVEKVAVATVQGKTYYLLVNALKEQNIPFISLMPGDSVPSKIAVVMTSEQEKPLITHSKILFLHEEAEIDSLIERARVLLAGKEAYRKVVFGIDPGVAVGLVALGDGKVIEEGNCYSTKEVIDGIQKITKHLDFAVTSVIVKIGNGVPIYRDLLEDLDNALPPQVVLEVVGEAGTNKPLKENKRSRGVRHISSATRIAGRYGTVVPRRKTFATHTRIQQNNAS